MMFVAAATLMFASCEKDDDTPTEAAANTLVLNGKVYQLNSHYDMGDERSYASAETTVLNSNGEPLYTIISDIESNTINHTYDLSKPVEGAIIFWSIHDADWEYQLGPILDEGTVTISRDENNFVYKVKGKQNGTTVSFNISVPASEWNTKK